LRRIGKVKVLDEENNFIMWTPQYQVKNKKAVFYGGKYMSSVDFGNKKITKKIRAVKKRNSLP
jgi:hypothetical protein